MRTLSRLAAAVLAAFVAFLVVVAAGTADAADDTGSQQTDPTAGDSRLRFGIGPAREVPADQYVDGRAYLTYAVNPGATLDDQVALLNFADHPIKLKVYATDALQDTTGAFGLLTGNETPRDAGSWFRFDLPRNGKVVIPARTGKLPGRALVPFRATIPANATPGDHVAGVLASLKVTSTNTEGAKIKLDQRIGIRAYFRVSGPLTPQLKIEKLKATYTDVSDPLGRGTIDVSYVVHNVGNIRLNAGQNVTVDRWLADPLTAQAPTLTDLLPGTRVTVHQTFKHAFGLGRLKATVDVFPQPVDSTYTQGIDPVSRSVTFSAWPWLLLVIIGGTLLLLILGPLFWRWRRHRRKQRLRLVDSDDDDGDSKAAAAPEPTRVGSHARRSVSGLAAMTVTLVAALLTSFGTSAQAVATDKSPAEVLLETGDVTAIPSHAIKDGWWGHEGNPKAPTGTGTTFISANATDAKGAVTDASIAALHEVLGDGNTFDNLRVAFVAASADGSAERPKVTKGENAGEAFTWFADLGFGGALSGNKNKNDSVITISTLDEYTAWWRAGRPLQGYDEDLKMVDIADDSSTAPADNPQGVSILNRWPAGTKISMVLYVSDGVDPNYPLIPTVAADKDGRAKAAWLTFTTVADPQDKSRSSAGYRVLSYSKGTLDAIATGKPAGGAQGAGDNKGHHGNGKGKGGKATDGSAGAPSDAGDQGSKNWLVSAVPGGATTLWIVLAGLVLGAVLLVTLRLRSRP
jgi:hypothetical protein